MYMYIVVGNVNYKNSTYVAMVEDYCGGKNAILQYSSSSSSDAERCRRHSSRMASLGDCVLLLVNKEKETLE